MGNFGLLYIFGSKAFLFFWRVFGDMNCLLCFWYVFAQRHEAFWLWSVFADRRSFFDLLYVFAVIFFGALMRRGAFFVDCGAFFCWQAFFFDLWCAFASRHVFVTRGAFWPTRMSWKQIPRVFLRTENVFWIWVRFCCHKKVSIDFVYVFVGRQGSFFELQCVFVDRCFCFFTSGALLLTCTFFIFWCVLLIGAFFLTFGAFSLTGVFFALCF